MPVAQVAAAQDAEIAALKEQVAAMQRQLKPPADGGPGA